MKKVSKKGKIIFAIISLIIIVGIAMTLTVGLNYDLRFQATKKIELYLQKEFEVSDIKQITNETIPNQDVIIQKVEVYEDTVSIIAKDITEEQKANLITKINEKYGTELSADSIQITTVPNTRGRDIVKPYIAPYAIATIVILAYMAVRYYKLNSSKVVLKATLILIIAQALLLSLIAITRMPVGRLTMPMSVTVYILTLIALTSEFEKQLDDMKVKEEKNKK
ncbi:MAG: hypothetical protein HFJ40_08490 [Clostridia bacterium]|nr:hypothetical protein [Clostridia bacterium]